MDWRPIETAPKDGTWIDLWLEVTPLNDGSVWGGSRRLVDCSYEDGQWTEHTCGRCTTGHSPAVNYAHERVTHWMPLPEPPSL